MTSPWRKPWTQEEKATVRKLAEEGEYAQTIAEVLGRNRNQIIGYCHRAKPRINLRHKQVPKPGRPKQPKVRRRNPLSQTRLKTVKQMLTREILAAGEPEPKHLAVIDLTSTTCRWPFGERYPYTFCGHLITETGQPYCPFHTQKSMP